MEWYYAEGSEQQGPVSEEEFQRLVSSGVVRPDTKVWNESMSNWVNYSEVAPSQPDTPPTISADGSTCSQCGGDFPSDEVVRISGQDVCAGCKPLFLQRIQEGDDVSTSYELAGIGARFGAKFLDGLIMLIPQTIINLIIGSAAQAGGAEAVVLLGTVLNIAIQAFYVIFMTGKYGATLGKMAAKIKIVKADGSTIGFGTATGRYFAEILSGCTLGIGYIIALFDDQKRTLHDRMCDTRVIKK